MTILPSGSIALERPSIQSLYLDIRFNGTSLASGTGFVAESAVGPVLLTARHNVTGRDHETDRPLSDTGGIPNEVCIWHVSAMYGINVRHHMIESLLDSSGSPRWHEHVTEQGPADFVALPLTRLEDVSLFPYSLGAGEPGIRVAAAERVSVVGFPFGLNAETGGTAIWATGFIASEPKLNYKGLPIFLIDCRTRQGQSGSAVVAYRGIGETVATEEGDMELLSEPACRFLGLYSGRVNEKSDIGMVWKAEAIRDLIATLKFSH